MSVLVDLDVPAYELRQALYGGHLVILTRLRAVTEFVEYTRQQLIELFKPHDPEHAHEFFDKTEMARILRSWKPRYIHSERAERLVCEIIREAGFQTKYTHYDVPKPRTSFPVGHLTTGIAFAFPWHRDVWYSAPAQQINWWLPVYAAREDNAMSFDLQCFDREVPNSSGTFDYYENNAGRLNTAAAVTQERQARPVALDYQPLHDLVVLPPPGAVLLFSGAQLHKSIPNTSGRARFSVDFRTVDVTDLELGRGAPLVDVNCTGTAVRDFHNVDDGGAFEEAMVERLFGAPPADAMLVFSAAEAERSAPSGLTRSRAGTGSMPKLM
jgi:hypothetical protein